MYEHIQKTKFKLNQFRFEKFQKIFKVQFKSTGFEKISKISKSNSN